MVNLKDISDKNAVAEKHLEEVKQEVWKQKTKKRVPEPLLSANF